VLKYLGTTFEREVVDVTRTVSEVVPALGGDGLAGLLAQAQLAAPGFSIRGGTDEMLLTIVSRGAPVPAERGHDLADRADGGDVGELGRMADDVLGSAPPDPWATVVDLGWTGVGVAEDDGGSGGTFADLAALVRATGRHAQALPLAEAATGRAGGADLAAVADDLVVLDGRVTATADVAWHEPAGSLLLLGPGTAARIDLSADGVTTRPWCDVAGRPRLRVEATGVAAAQVPGSAAALTVLQVHAALGAVVGACRLTREYVTTRVQFGRPLVRMQAVAHRLAEMECARVLLEVAASAALGLEPARVAAAAALLDPVATEVARLAHQLHGAMGITHEHSLHRYTTLLWALRDEIGPARRWAARLHDLAGTEEALWTTVTTRPAGR
jgi:alkylation response protein AidB-like acyl-CoA dehydrogenase